MRPVSTARLVPAAVVLSLAPALLLPANAGAEACTGATRLVTQEQATRSVTITPGTRIGPIAIGMSRRAITRVAGRGVYVKARGAYRFRVSGMPVYVTFGHWGRARVLWADSGRLVVNDVRLSEGADAVNAVIGQAEVSNCVTYTTSTVRASRRQTTFSFFRAPALPRVVIVHTAMRR